MRLRPPLLALLRTPALTSCPRPFASDLRYVADEAAENAWKDDWDYLGCYADNGPTRLLSGTKFNDWQNSPDFCRASCSNLGFAIAAVAFSSECWVRPRSPPLPPCLH